MGVVMIEYENQLSSRSVKHVEDRSEKRGVVVYLSSHRRWQSRTCWDRADYLAGQTDPFYDEESCSPPLPVIAGNTEIPAIREPSLWLAGLVALISFASIIGLYWACTLAIEQVIALSFAHF